MTLFINIFLKVSNRLQTSQDIRLLSCIFMICVSSFIVFCLSYYHIVIIFMILCVIIYCKCVCAIKILSIKCIIINKHKNSWGLFKIKKLLINLNNLYQARISNQIIYWIKHSQVHVHHNHNVA